MDGTKVDRDGDEIVEGDTLVRVAAKVQNRR